MRVLAYEQLWKMDDSSISQETIGGRFSLEQVVQTSYREVYASRSGEPRIVLFGAPLRCRPNLFVQSRNGEVTINAPSGQEYVQLIRKVPGRPDFAQLKSSYDLSDIIRTLCEEPKTVKGVVIRSGLNVPYSEALALIKQLCDTGMVDAKFEAGALPKVE
jgi:hypothetical protein